MSDPADNITVEPKSSKAKEVLGLYLLPFVYFYLLSFMLLAVASYMLVKNPIGIKSSFASEIENPGQSDVKITLVTEQNNEQIDFECRKEIADKIDAFFGQWNLPLTGNGCAFDVHGQISNVDPIFVASIAFIESTGGKKTPKYEGIESYNPFGYGVYDDAKLTAELDHHLCQSFDDCIGRVTRAIRRNASERSISTDPLDVVTWYNPGSVRNAGGNPENASWYRKIRITMDQINKMEVITEPVNL